MRHADVSTPLALIVCRFLLWMVKQIDAPAAEFFESLAKLTRERERERAFDVSWFHRHTRLLRPLTSGLSGAADASSSRPGEKKKSRRDAAQLGSLVADGERETLPW